MKSLALSGLKLVTNPMAKRFSAALESPQQAQQIVLENIVQELAQTGYGRSLGISGLSDFRTKLPIVDYDDLRPWIAQQQNQENRALVADKVLFYEKTSGSSGPQKYIPYTRALQQSFTSMFLLWANNLIANVSGLGSGKLYFSISPNFDVERKTEQGVPIGLENDAEYLGSIWRRLLNPFVHSDPKLALIREPQIFKQELALSLLGCQDLESISIWNPSFLIVLLNWIEANRELLIKTMGTSLSPQRRQALELSDIDWMTLWPKLKIISCWADGNAAPLAKRLVDIFPQVYVQGKGLLATEAPITIPMVGINGGVPLVSHTYLEFLADDGDLYGLSELEQGACYEVVISQRGGLYRYRMGDQVQVVGRIANTPTLKFVGRNNRTSDLVGEKLNESFVAQVIESLPLENIGYRTLFAVRAPADGYVLLLDREPENVDRVQRLLEHKLQQAYHYRHARALGQLMPAQVAIRPEADTIVSRITVEKGKRLGDQKQNYLMLHDEAIQNELNLNQFSN